MNESHSLERIAVALETIAENARMVANPTLEELQTRLQRSMDTAKFLDKLMPNADEPIN